jgi:hypothetical protein
LVLLVTPPCKPFKSSLDEKPLNIFEYYTVLRSQFGSAECPAGAITCEEMWIRVCFNPTLLLLMIFVKDRINIDSVEQVIGSCGDGDPCARMW